MAKKPYKFRQARKDAKAAAKKAFPGKVKARRVDPKIKISAEDRLALKEAQDTAKRELGNKAYLSRAEYEAQQRAAREAFRERMREEFGEYGGKKAEPAAAEEAKPKRAAKKAAVKKAAVKKAVAKKAVAPKPAVKKAAVKKAAVPAATGEKKMTRAERSAANKARWKSMTPAERKNWAATRNAPAAAADDTPRMDPAKRAKIEASNRKIVEEARAKNDAGKPAAKKAAAPRYPSVAGKSGKRAKTIGQVNEAVTKKTSKTKRPTLAQLKRQEAKGLEEAKARVEARKAGAGAKPRGMKSGEKPGQQPTAKAKPSVKPAAASKGSKLLRKVKGAGKLGIIGALAAETYGLASGSTVDNVREIQRLENKLANLTGKRDSNAKVFLKGAGSEIGQLANLSTLGIVGKNRRQRMDELNALIAKEQAKQAKAQAKANAKLRYGPGGESLVPGTAAYKAGSKTRPTKAQVAANFQAAKGSTTGGATGGTGTGGAGSTIKVTPGSSYTVKKGDTLSAIAKSAGVSLADLRAANKKFKTNPKYKQGSMIFSGTTVKIPKKK